MKDYIENKVNSWASKPNNDDIRDVNLKIDYLAHKLYFDYEPTHGPFPDFLTRLEKWLKNIESDEDQESFFRLIPELFYVGEAEFRSLYRSAYNGPIIRWLISQENIKLDDKNLNILLKAAIESTWFCPVSDSMKINSFYHLNKIPGNHDHRPEWRSMAEIGKKGFQKDIKDYINKKSIKYLVLLEDFVGSGKQINETINFAANISDDLHILVVPLMICPAGVNKANELMKTYEKLDFGQVIIMPESAFILPDPQADEVELFSKIRKIIIKYYYKINKNVSSKDKPYGPFGFQNTGGLVVMYSNTPDNTLPSLHWNSPTWDALFPRHSRV